MGGIGSGRPMAPLTLQILDLSDDGLPPKEIAGRLNLKPSIVHKARAKHWDGGGSNCCRCRIKPRVANESLCRDCKRREAERPDVPPRHLCGACGKVGHNELTCPDAKKAEFCRCGLRLPCNDCVPSATELATRGQGGWSWV